MSIEFYALVYDVHDSLEYFCDFQSLDSAIDAIEDFLEKPISEWVNYNKIGQYPIDVDDKIGPNEESSKQLNKDAVEKKISLPQKGNYRLNLSLVLPNEDSYNAFMEKVNTHEDYAIL